VKRKDYLRIVSAMANLEATRDQLANLEVRRRKLIFELYVLGAPVTEIADAAGISRQTIHAWIKDGDTQRET
jgi:DNA-directed RNA polymerase specialized sigma24 family protein